MKPDIAKEEESAIKKLREQYNIIPSVTWSVIGLLPISIFCYNFMELKLLFIFLGVCMLIIFLPGTFFYRIQVSKKAITYKKLGVPFIKKFTQNGDIINKLIKKRYPNASVVSFKKSSAKNLLQQTYIFEKFHYILFLFFLFTTVFALIKSLFGWAIVITITNIIYNIYPNLLQQYIRIKLIGASRM